MRWACWFLFLVASVLGLTVLAADPAPPQPAVLVEPLTPGDVIRLCASDAVKLTPEVAAHTRYLSLHNLPDADRALAVQVIGGLVNSLSREPDIVRPVLCGDGLLLRIYLDDYGKNFFEAWEKLADQEPYFHALLATETIIKGTRKRSYGHYGPDGKFVHEEYRDEPTEEKKRVVQTAFAPWLANTPERQAALLQLVGLMGGTKVPVVTAEWFVFQVSVQADRKPGYYDFLGVKDEKTFQATVGFTKDNIDPGFLREVRESVAVSGVTLQPRALLRFPTVGGAYWLSKDVRIAKDKSNPLRVLNDELVFDATEQYGHLPNGLWATGLFDAKGVRQDTAPDFIASDSKAPHNDRRVHVGLSCIRCHDNGGLKDIDGWVRGVLNSPPNFLASPDPNELRKLRQQYLRRLEPFLDSDRKRYAEALAEATDGMTPKEFAAGLADLWKRYAEDAVTLERAARDLGVTEECFVKALVDQGLNGDLVLSAFRAKPARVIPVTSWHESFILAQLALAGKECKWKDQIVLPEKKDEGKEGPK